MSSIGTLYYTQPQVYKAQKALVTAKFNGLTVDAKVFDTEKDIKRPDFLAKNPCGKVPFLQTDMGCIFTSMSIARYIARCRSDTSMYGRSFLEEGLIDTWLDFCTHEIEVPLMTWVYPCMGLMQDIPAATAQAKEDVKKALGELESALKAQPYLVGQELSLADVALVCSLKEGFARVFDDAYRKPFPKVTEWFKKCCALPQFTTVLGDVALCSKAEAPKPFVPPPRTADKAEAKPKEEAKKGKKEEKPAAKPAAEPAGKKDKASKPAAEPAPAAGGGAIDEAAIKAVGDDIRVLKEKLKAEGMSGGQINKDERITALVDKLTKLKKGEAVPMDKPKAASPKASPKQAPKKGKDSPASKPAAPPAAGGIDEAAIKAVGDEIRELKEKLKAEGMSGGQINKDARIAALVEKLNTLKKGEAPAPAPAPAAGGGGGDIASQVEAVGNQIRELKEKLKGEGMSGKQINQHAEVKALVDQLTELKKQM